MVKTRLTNAYYPSFVAEKAQVERQLFTIESTGRDLDDSSSARSAATSDSDIGSTESSSTISGNKIRGIDPVIGRSRSISIDSCTTSDDEMGTDRDLSTVDSTLGGSTLSEKVTRNRSINSTESSSGGGSSGAWEDVHDNGTVNSTLSGDHGTDTDGTDTDGCLSISSRSVISAFDSENSGNETDTCEISIDEHLERRHAKWLALRKAAKQEMKAAQQIKVQEKKRQQFVQLNNVDHVSHVDVASTNRDLSVVESMKKRDARAAFERNVPHEIPVLIRDDVSSIHLPTCASPHLASVFGRYRTASQDVELGAVGNVTGDSILEKLKQGLCTGQRNDLELFFIGLISVSLVMLVVLLIVVLARN